MTPREQWEAGTFIRTTGAVVAFIIITPIMGLSGYISLDPSQSFYDILIGYAVTLGLPMIIFTIGAVITEKSGLDYYGNPYAK